MSHLQPLLSREHFDTLTDEIHLYLLLAGLKIAYGGALKGGFSGTSNFTLRLFELVRAYSKLAEGVNARPLQGAILNVASWPLWLAYGENEWRLFSGDIAGYEQAPRPDLPWSDDEVFPPRAGARLLGSDTPERRYTWARGLTAMRERITALSQARLVIGGKLTGFSGLWPGVDGLARDLAEDDIIAGQRGHHQARPAYVRPIGSVALKCFMADLPVSYQ